MVPIVEKTKAAIAIPKGAIAIPKGAKSRNRTTRGKVFWTRTRILCLIVFIIMEIWVWNRQITLNDSIADKDGKGIESGEKGAQWNWYWYLSLRVMFVFMTLVPHGAFEGVPSGSWAADNFQGKDALVKVATSPWAITQFMFWKVATLILLFSVAQNAINQIDLVPDAITIPETPDINWLGTRIVLLVLVLIVFLIPRVHAIIMPGLPITLVISSLTAALLMGRRVYSHYGDNTSVARTTASFIYFAALWTIIMGIFVQVMNKNTLHFTGSHKELIAKYLPPLIIMVLLPCVVIYSVYSYSDETEIADEDVDSAEIQDSGAIITTIYYCGLLVLLYGAQRVSSGDNPNKSGTIMFILAFTVFVGRAVSIIYMSWWQNDKNEEEWCRIMNCDDRAKLMKNARDRTTIQGDTVATATQAVRSFLNGAPLIPDDIIERDIDNNFLTCCNVEEKNIYYDEGTRDSYEEEAREETCTDIGTTCDDNTHQCDKALGCLDSFICVDDQGESQYCPIYDTNKTCGQCITTRACTGRALCDYDKKEECTINHCHWTPSKKADPDELNRNLMAASRSEEHERSDIDDGIYA